MGNIIVVLIIAAIITAAIAKIIIEKRKGAKCVGCHYGKPGAPGCGCGDSNYKGKQKEKGSP